MKLQVDIRESDLIELFKTKLEEYGYTSYELEIINLPIGDVILCNDDNTPEIIFERKKLTDLASSIRDGRYNEQSLRLHHSEVHNHNIIYLIEGSMKYYKPRFTKIDAKTLYSSMLSLNYYKGFSVIRTFDLEESSEFILRCLDKIHREKQKKTLPFYKNQTLDNNTNEEKNEVNTLFKPEFVETIGEKPTQEKQKMNVEYSSVVKKVKKENLTPENIGEIILSQIPGISNVSSLAIMKHFGSLYNLMKCLNENKQCLHGFTYETSNGQKRKISKTMVQNIIDYLLYQKESVISLEHE